MTTEQKTSTSGVNSDEMVSRIDAATSEASNDIDPESLEAQLRLLLPGATFWTRERIDLPRQLAQMAENADVHVIGGPPPMWRAHAVWTVPNGQPFEGVWQTAVNPCKSAPHLNHIIINGPDTELTRDQITTGDAIDLLAAVSGIKSKS